MGYGRIAPSMAECTEMDGVMDAPVVPFFSVAGLVEKLRSKVGLAPR